MKLLSVAVLRIITRDASSVQTICLCVRGTRWFGRAPRYQAASLELKDPAGFRGVVG